MIKYSIPEYTDEQVEKMFTPEIINGLIGDLGFVAEDKNNKLKNKRGNNMSKNFNSIKNAVYEEITNTRTAISKRGISELASKEFLSTGINSHIGYVFNGLAHTKEYAGKRLTIEQENKLRSYNGQLQDFLNLLSDVQRYHFGRHKKNEPEAKEKLFNFLDKHEHEIFKEVKKETTKEEHHAKVAK